MYRRSRSKPAMSRLKKAAGMLIYCICAAAMAAALAASGESIRQPYHTSALTGEAWVKELISGHPDRIYHELGMKLEVFIPFVMELRCCGLKDGRLISVEEQAAIFLYMSVTGLRLRHVAERFQHSHETISLYFRKVLFTVTSAQFYSKYVHLPTVGDPVPTHILDNPKFFPYFKDCDGAFDGTHIAATAAAIDHDTA